MEKNVLPPDFDGTFRFTNWTDRDFTAKWGGVEYTFPAMKTTPIIIPTLTPLEVQNVRKKFALELAQREFGNSDTLKAMEAKNQGVSGFKASVTYALQDLEPLVQKCLEPLEAGRAEVKEIPKPEFTPKATKVLKSKLSGDETDDSLVGQGKVVA